MMKIIKKIIRFFDKLEDRIRGYLSHIPILYAFIGGTGVVLFWRGVWHTADYLVTGVKPWWDGPVSLIGGTVLLLSTGIFVSDFIGSEIIISGLKSEKKLSDKTEDEVEAELSLSVEIEKELEAVVERLDEIEGRLPKGSGERK